jgi:ABC-type spermidine/putrescine transport system permease subunit I
MERMKLLKSAFYKYGLLLPLSLYLIYFFVYPAVSLFLTSFFAPDFTLEHYVRIYHRPVYLRVILSTFRLSLICTLFSLLLGYPLAYFLDRVKPNTRNILLIFIVLPFWTSILVRMYAWMVILGRQGIINSMLMKLGLISVPLDLLYNTFSVTIGMVHFLLPFMVFPIYSVMSGIDKDTIKAAYSMGAHPFTAFIKVYLPLSLPGVGAGCLIVFILGIGFFVTPALLGGREDMVISTLIDYQVSLKANWPFAAAISLVLLLLTLVLFNFSNRFLKIDRIWGTKK